jgi:hypothetical protein
MATRKVNARFWVYINGGPVKLTLKPGQALSWSRGGRTEEGWSRESESWEWDGEDWPGVLRHAWLSEGRDCDGYLSHDGEDICRRAGLRSGDFPCLDYCENPAAWDGVRWPAWEKVRSWQRDEYAELAGY